jgi:hypothetical protein
LREKIIHRGDNFYLQGRISVDGSTLEIWRGFRELAMCRVLQGATKFDFDGEWCGWDHILKLYLVIYIPSKLNDGERILESSEIDCIAETVYRGLCGLKQRNVVLLMGERSEPVPTDERDNILREFGSFMTGQGWRVRLNDSRTSIKLERRGLGFNAKRHHDSVPQGRWLAKAFDALLREPQEFRTLFVSERARYSTVAY